MTERREITGNEKDRGFIIYLCRSETRRAGNERRSDGRRLLLANAFQTRDMKAEIVRISNFDVTSTSTRFIGMIYGMGEEFSAFACRQMA